MNVDRDAILVHQVHPVKLAFDIAASLVSNALLWQHRLAAGLASRYLLPIAGSALVLSFADIDRLRNTKRGQYVLHHMPPASTALRLGGDTLMAVGPRRPQPPRILARTPFVAGGRAPAGFFGPRSPHPSNYLTHPMGPRSHVAGA